MGSRTEVRGLLLKDTGGQLRHFGGRKGRRRSADAETFDILLEADEGHLTDSMFWMKSKIHL